MRFLLIIFIAVVVTVAYSCTSDETRWEKIKQTGNIYPRDTIIAYNSFVDGSAERRWVNKSYKTYQYKKYCEHFVETRFELSNSKVKGFLFFDSLGLAKLLRDHFRKKGVTHFVAQILTKDELIVYLYHEDNMNPIGTVSDFIVPNIGTIKSDPDWKEYSRL